MLTQHELMAMHELPQTFCPAGHVHPPVVQICVPVHAGAPLHVQVPLLHVLVVVPPQSLLVQHRIDEMHDPLQSFCPAGHVQPAPVQTSPAVHSIAPLHVQVPALHAFVDELVQSLAVQQSDAGMQPAPHLL